MTKEELAKRKGIKLPEKKETPAEALIKNTSDEKASMKAEEKSTLKKNSTKKASSAATKKTSNSKSTTPKKTVKSDTSTPKNKSTNNAPEPAQVKTESANFTPKTPISNTSASLDNTKRGVGKPKKRKPGDKKLSLWIDEALVDRMYNNLSYGDSAGELLNKALLEYLDNHNLH